MPRVHHVKSARKSKIKRTCRRCGKVIKPGDSYYHFANRIGRSSITKVFCNEHPPKASDKTTSDKLSQLYAAQENYSEHCDKLETFEDIAQAMHDAAEVAETVGQEYQDSFDNMPEQLQESSGIQEKIDSCESWHQELENAASEIEITDWPDDEEAQAKALEEARSNGQSAIDSLEL